jgi:hypothetical protein
VAIATTTATMRMPYDASLFIGTSDKGVPPLLYRLRTAAPRREYDL